MPLNKNLWRATVQGVNGPVYLVSQNIQSAYATLSAPTTVDPEQVSRIELVCSWDQHDASGPVGWPPLPPEPPPDESDL